MRQALAALILLATPFVATSISDAYGGVEIGQAAPALVVQELNGQSFDLAAQRGRVVVINFWATWCPPCQAEMPTLDAFYRRYHGEGLEMIGLAANRLHERSDVAKAMQSFGYPAAMLRDCEANGFNDPTELPITYIVDEQGTVRAKLTPDETPLNEQSLSKAVMPLLSERAATHDTGKRH